MKNKDNYIPPLCEERALNLESTVLNPASFQLNDFEDGGEIC